MGRGFHVPASIDDTLVEQRILEQATIVPGAAITGWASLRWHGANLCTGLAGDGRTPIAVPLTGPQQTRPGPGFRHRRTTIPPAELVVRHGLLCTTPLRAAADAMCDAATLVDAVIIGDIACSAGLVSLPDLRQHLTQRSRTPGLTRARKAVGFVSARVRSPGETRLRLIWRLDAGLPEPLCNWPILDLDGRWLGAPDLWCPRLGIYAEYDGAGHRTREEQATDASRDTLFADMGLEGLRVVGTDIANVDRVVSRIRSAITRAATSQRPRLYRPGDRPRPLV